MNDFDSLLKHYKAVCESWRNHARRTRKRAECVRLVAAYLRGEQVPPDGLTRAEVYWRSPGWPGWEWSRRGLAVTLAARDKAEADAAKAFASLAQESNRRSEQAFNDRRAVDLQYAREGRENPNPPIPDRVLEECILPAQKAVREAIEASSDEKAAWSEYSAARESAGWEIPVNEIEAAKAARDREAAQETPPTPPVRVEVVGPVEVAGMPALVENTQAAALAAHRAATEATLAADAAEGAAQNDLHSDVEEIKDGVSYLVQNKTDKSKKGRKYGKQGENERKQDPDVQKRKTAIENALLRIKRKVKKGALPSEACRWECANGKLLNERGEPMKPKRLQDIYSERFGKRRKR